MDLDYFRKFRIKAYEKIYVSFSMGIKLDTKPEQYVATIWHLLCHEGAISPMRPLHSKKILNCDMKVLVDYFLGHNSNIMAMHPMESDFMLRILTC